MFEEIVNSIDQDITLESFTVEFSDFVSTAAVKYNPTHETYRLVVDEVVQVMSLSRELIEDYYNGHYNRTMQRQNNLNKA